MKYNRILLTFIMALLASQFAYSNPNCPPASSVSAVWQEVNDAIPDEVHSYIVKSPPLINYSDFIWSARTIVPAHNQQDAVKLAQITVREISSLMTPTSIKVLNDYSCIYFSPRAFVYAVTKIRS